MNGARLIPAHPKHRLTSIDINYPPFPEGLEVFDPVVIITNDSSKVEYGGTKKIEYTIIPRIRGQLEIPPFSIYYFDIKDEKWKQKSTRSFKINILPDKREYYLNSGLSKDQIQLLEKDIKFLNTSNPKWKKRSNKLFNYIDYIMILSILAILFSSKIITLLSSKKSTSGLSPN